VALFVVAVSATLVFTNEGPFYSLAKGTVLLLMVIVALRGLGRGLVRDTRVSLGPFALAAIVVLALSAVVSAAHGVPFWNWLTDAVAPLAFALSPFAALQVAERASSRALHVTLASAGLVAAVSYALYWRDTRGLAEVGSASGLASWYVPLGAGVYFATRPLRRASLGRILYVATVMGLLVVSGSRITLIPVGLFCCWLVIRPIFVEARPAKRWQITIGALSILTVSLVISGATGIARGPGTQRFLSSFDLLESGLAEDLSYRERVRQTQVALEAFDESPLLGVGPGYVYEWTGPTGLFKRRTFAETPAGLISDFGLVGAGVFAALIGAIAVRSTMRLRAVRHGNRSPADEAVLVVCAAGIANAIVASPFDDKGLAIVLLLLLARSFQDAGAPPQTSDPSKTQLRRRLRKWPVS
jgi:O-antigen ligase